MWSFLRIVRAFRHRDSGGRIRALRREAARDPQGSAAWILAIELWEKGELAEAHGLAEAILEREPADFYCLAICLDYQIRAGDSERILEYARRLTAADAPVGFRRRPGAIANGALTPLRILGNGRSVRETADVLNRWARWAQDYVESHSPATAET
jgi:hypothetical protein